MRSNNNHEGRQYRDRGNVVVAVLSSSEMNDNYDDTHSTIVQRTSRKRQTTHGRWKSRRMKQPTKKMSMTFLVLLLLLSVLEPSSIIFITNTAFAFIPHPNRLCRLSSFGSSLSTRRIVVSFLKNTQQPRYHHSTPQRYHQWQLHQSMTTENGPSSSSSSSTDSDTEDTTTIMSEAKAKAYAMKEEAKRIRDEAEKLNESLMKQKEEKNNLLIQKKNKQTNESLFSVVPATSTKINKNGMADEDNGETRNPLDEAVTAKTSVEIIAPSDNHDMKREKKSLKRKISELRQRLVGRRRRKRNDEANDNTNEIQATVSTTNNKKKDDATTSTTVVLTGRSTSADDDDNRVVEQESAKVEEEEDLQVVTAINDKSDSNNATDLVLLSKDDKEDVNGDDDNYTEIEITINNKTITKRVKASGIDVDYDSVIDDKTAKHWIEGLLDEEDLQLLEDANATLDDFTLVDLDEVVKEIPVMRRILDSLGDITGKGDNVTIEDLLETIESSGGFNANETFASILQDEVTFSSAFPSKVTYTYIDDSMDGFLTKDEINGIFLSQVLRGHFRPTSKPIRVPGGYYITGINQKSSGDVLIQGLDEQMSKYFPSATNVQINYVRDLKTFLDMDEMQMADALSEADLASAVIDFESMLGGALYITPQMSTISELERTPTVLRMILTTMTLVSTSLFSTSCYLGLPDADLFDVLSINNILFGIQTPLFLAIWSILLSHEAGHAFVAFIRGMTIELPSFFIPSPSFGTMGGITPLKESPKNANELFDFALGGPLAALITSCWFLVQGLSQTMSLTTSQMDELPRLSENVVLQLSTLATGIIETVVGGRDVLLSTLDMDAMITTTAQTLPCHPFTIAGYFGLWFTALQLLPLPGTDGGRIAQTVFGRNTGSEIPRFVGTIALFSLAVYLIETSQLPLAYAATTFLFINQPEIPLRNEVDALSNFRLAISIGIACFVSLTLCPIF